MLYTLHLKVELEIIHKAYSCFVWRLLFFPGRQEEVGVFIQGSGGVQGGAGVMGPDDGWPDFEIGKFNTSLFFWLMIIQGH